MVALNELILGFIGLGTMGGPMCTNLVRRSGATVVAFDLDPAAQARVQAAGADLPGSVDGVCAQADIVFLCLQNTEAVASVCRRIAEIPGRVKLVIDCSTSSVGTTHVIARQLEAAGCNFADAPIARMRQAAVDGTLCFMVGASLEIFARLRPLLAHMGTDILHCGPVGSGQVVKILNNMVLIQNVHALAGALCAAKAYGVSGDLLFDAFSKGSADSLALHRQGMKHLLTGDFPERTFSSRYARKDVGLAEELFTGGGVDPALLRATADLLDAACLAGLAEAYYPAFVSLLAHPAKAEA